MAPGNDPSRERVAEIVSRILADILPDGPAVEVPLRDQGLDSMLTARLWLAAGEELGLDLPVLRIGPGATVADVVADIVARRADAADPGPVATDPARRYEPFPLTPMQESYLLARALGPDRIGCHQYLEFEVPDLAPDRLAQAWRLLVARHDMLRATVDATGQRVSADPPAWSLPVHDLRAAGPTDLAGHLDQVRDRLAHRRCQGSVWPPFAIEATLRQDAPALVHFSIDLAVTDGHGLALLLAQWSDSYHGRPLPAPQDDLSVRDCVLALAAHRTGRRREADLAYWTRRLAGLPAGPFTRYLTDDDGTWHSLTGTLAPRRWQAVRARAVRAGCTPNALLATVLAEAIAVVADDPFALVVTTTDRVRLSAAAELVGPFTSAAVIRLDDPYGTGFDDAVADIDDQLGGALEHGAMSSVEALRALRAAGATPPPLPVVFTSLLGTGPHDGGFADQVTTAVAQTSGVLLEVQVWEAHGALHYRFDVADALPERVVATVFAAFANALTLAAGAGEPERRALNPLQQAYYVAKQAGGRRRWHGGQMYLSFELSDVDVPRLESALGAMIEAHEAMRSTTGRDGSLLVLPAERAPWRIPVFDAEDPDLERLLRTELTGRTLPLGRWPQFDIRVTRRGAAATVHLVFDLIVFDGYSIHRLGRELLARYADPDRNTGTPTVGRGAAAPAEAWRARLAHLPPGPDLPGPDLPGRAAAPDRARTRLAGTLGGWHALRALADRHGVGVDMVLLAAFTGVLARHAADPDFAVPVVRWTEAVRSAPGEHTVLSWVRAEEGESVADRAAAYARQIDADPAGCGLTELRRRVLRERGSRPFEYPVVYTSVVDVAELPPIGAAATGTWLSCTPDVSLDCIGLAIGDDTLYYCWDVVAADFADGFLDTAFAEFGTALAELAGTKAAGPLSAAQRHQILYEWNDTARWFSTERLCHELVADQAAARPDAVAVRGRRGATTFGELNGSANRIAWALLERGVRPGDIVAVRMRRGPEMIAAVLGILKAGAAYLPMEPSLPSARGADMLAQTGTRLVLGTTATPRWDAPDGVAELAVDSLPADPGAVDPPRQSDVDSLAYVIFTSGSTGRPKGVAVTHRPVLNLLAWAWRTYGFDEHDIGLLVTSLGFDLSVFDIFGVLGRGGGLYVADEEQQRDPALLLDILLTQPVTFWNSAPATLAQLGPALPAVAAAPGRDSLRLVFLSGDYTPLSLPDQVRAVFTGARLVSLGGATEATVWSNYFDIDTIDPRWHSIPYGRPIDNARYHVLDEALRPCPVGAAGDLYIGGACLSSGYYRRPELTAERFIVDPFADTPGARLYRTGDRAAYFPDGNLCFLGRLDGQVKIRGFRVELGEIEHRLRAHPGVREVVVLAEASGGDHRLTAFVMPESTPPPVAQLRAFAAETLPSYMVPNFVTFLESFPATANGKLDREALLHGVPVAAAATTVPPAAMVAGAAEVAALFAEVLGVERVDTHEDLWDQGATSFTVVQVSNLLQARYGHRIPVSAVLAEPTATGIARVLAEAAAVDNTAVDKPQPPTPTPQAELDFFSAADRAAFKAAKRHLRPTDPAEPALALEPAAITQEYYDWRANCRDFLPGPVSFAALSQLLALVRTATVDGHGRHLYPSAGDSYAVQVYVEVADGAVADVPAGRYYYHPESHALHRVSPGGPNRSAHFYYNRPIADAAAFTLHLVGQTRAITPVYGAQAQRYLQVEAGSIAQLLLTGQAACGLGLCLIGEVAQTTLRADLALDDGHQLLLTLLGGRVAHQEVATTGERPPFAVAGAVRPPRRGIEDGVAVIGMSGRYAGAVDLDALWPRLATGTSGITAVPATRPELAAVTTEPGGFLDRIDVFDARLFGIRPDEADTLDPQLRLVLEAVWTCLNDAGHSTASLARVAPRVGVFVAAMWQDYQQVGADAWRDGAAASVAAVSSEIPGRVSSFFGFRGPSMVVDTSCSSSLTALHLAVQSLRRGECDAAVVAAVNLVSHPYHWAALRQAGLLVRGATAGAFDAEHPGWLLGEGAGALLLRRSDAAVADGDVVHGLLAASAIGHVGGVVGYGVPDADAQAGSIRAVLADAGLTPDDIDYVEISAAGAAIADATELEALSTVFGQVPVPRPMGTVKPNLGHLESAAGLSQVTKVLLQLRHDVIAPTLSSVRRNPLVAWSRLPLRLADAALPWPRGGTAVRRALVSSYGAAGSVAQVIVTDPPAAPGAVAPAVPAGTAELIVLSATDDESLRAVAGGLLARTAAWVGDDIAAIAHTTQTADPGLAARLIVRCRDVAGLTGALAAFVAGREHPDVWSRGSARTEEPARTWLAGGIVDWHLRWPTPPARVSLPPYPMAREHHWLRRPEPRRPAPSVLDYLRRAAADVLGMAADDVRPDDPLEDYGLTSAQVVALTERLTARVGEVPATLFFRHPTLRAIADQLAAEFPAALVDATAEPVRADEDFAVIGMAGRYPDAPDLARFWENLVAGKDSVRPVPASRRRAAVPPDLMVGGFLDDVESFDSLFFSISPRDAELMDPQERLFLEVVWAALEDACYPKRRLADRHHGRVGVFAATMYQEYAYFGVEQSLTGEPVSTASSPAGIANRVSYFLDLRGPSMTVDTMCSGALTAFHLAIAALRRGECEAAIVGGVNLCLHPAKFVEQARLGMTATDHRCRAFGADGDGFAPGEGVGAMVVKPLRGAVADGDRVLAVVKGTAVGHGGRSNGYLVPNPVRQGEVVREALAAAGVAPETISYVEAHGTGTPLGDPVELDGLGLAFGTGAGPGGCAIGSVKSNIGHLEGAAGIAALTKVILQLRHRTLVPSIHTDRLSEVIRWDRVPFRVQRTVGEWVTGPGLPRRAGVSAFGAGGSNAHLVVEEYPAAPAPAEVAGPQAIVLSATDPDRLAAVAGQLLDFLNGPQPLPTLAEIAATLQIGREPLKHRVSFVVDDLAALLAGLTGFLAGRSHPATGESTELAELAARWAAGEDVDWSVRLGSAPRCAALPAYPFARERHWLPDRDQGVTASVAGPPTVSAAHPAPPRTPLLAKCWLPVPPEPVPNVASSGPVACLVPADPGSVAAAIVPELARFFAPGRLVTVELGPATDVDTAIRELASAGSLVGWLDLCDLDAPDAADLPAARLRLVQWLLRSGSGAAPRACHVTSGLQEPDEPVGGLVPRPAGGYVAGLLRVLPAEHPALRVRLVDVGDLLWSPRAVAELVVAEWAGSDGHVEVCHRGGARYAATLAPIENAAHAVRLDPARVYVVSGGTRGIGARCARHLVAAGARKLAVLGRRPRTPDDEAVGALTRAGAEVRSYHGPLTDHAALAGFLRGVRAELGPIGGVLHCAGTFPAAPAPFTRLAVAELAAIAEPKVSGLVSLADACAGDDLAFFLAFSSISAEVPAVAAGVAGYAAANAFQDFYVGHQRRRGHTAFRSVAWPSWRDTGTPGPNPGARLGIGDLSDIEGLAVLDRVLADTPSATVIPWPAVAPEPRPDAGQVRPSGSAARKVESTVDSTGGALTTPRADWLAEVAADVLGMAAGRLDPDAEFGDLGMESVTMAEFVRRIEARLGDVRIEPTAILTHGTVHRLATHLATVFPERVAARTASPAPQAHPADERIAIVGMAATLPGAPDLTTFWANLRAGRCAVTEVPVSRWDPAVHYRPGGGPGASVSKWGGFVAGIEDFDPDYFGLTDDEALCLDPAARLMLENVAVGLADAGYTRQELWGRDVGVFVGGRMSEYRQRVGIRGDGAGFGTDQNFIAARVAHQFNFCGPNLVVDTACSSGLVAVSIAVRSLLSGESDVAFACGVEVLLDERPYLEFSAIQAVSPKGRCAAFDEDADGFVPGEGCGVLVMKRLSDALADGDRVHAVLEGVATGNDGHTMGLTTPNPVAQAKVIRRALAAAGVDARRIGMVEAHGTGTMIGDPIELRALTDVFGESTSDTGFCGIGSVKSGIGHLLSAAGIAGLIKAVLAVEHGELPPTLFCDHPNPRFSFASSPFYPVTALRPWPADGRRLAGVSSFGFGGTNAHVVVGEAVGGPGRRPALPAPVFRRRRLWLDAVPAVRTGPAVSDLDFTYRTTVRHTDFVMTDHHVHDVSVLPGVVLVELVFRALAEHGVDTAGAVLTDILFPEAIRTGPGVDREVRVTVTPAGDHHMATVDSALSTIGELRWHRNATARLSLDAPQEPARIDPAALMARAGDSRAMSELYAQARAEGIVHGSRMMAEGTLYTGGDWLLAQLRLADPTPEADRYRLHPGMLDATTLVAFARTPLLGEPFIPMFVESVRVARPLAGPAYVFVPRTEEVAASGDMMRNDYLIFDENGRFVAEVRGLACKRIRHAGLIALPEPEPEPEPAARPPARPHRPRSRPVGLADHVRQLVALRIDRPVTEVPLTTGFHELGLDSAALLAIAADLEHVVGARLYPTLLFEYATVAGLAEHLVAEYGHRDEAAEGGDARPCWDDDFPPLFSRVHRCRTGLNCLK